MKRFFITVILLIGFAQAHAAIDDNIDYNFIDNAFTQGNTTTNQDFEKVMQQYEKPQKEGLFSKIYKFFDKDKVKYDEAFKKKYENENNQPKRIKDIPEDKPTILITSKAYDANGNNIESGYYQISYKKDEFGKYTIQLSQGANKNVASLKAREIEEDEKAPSIVYGRAETLNNGYIKVIYSNLDLTLLGFLKVKENEALQFEPLY